MAGPMFRVAINGFWCHNETWDDAFEWDGKRDEVFLVVNTKVLDSTGSVLHNFDSQSETMGDSNNQPGRIPVGSASAKGGIRTNDRFPANPIQRTTPLNGPRIPPYPIWEGELNPGHDMVMLTPTIWEFDPGASFWNTWVEWQVSVDQQYGERAKDIFGKIWPVAKPVFDAVSLGIQTVGSLFGMWSPLGKPGSRPIGLRRDPKDPNGSTFNPTILALNSESAEYLASSNLSGHGQGILEINYVDDPHLQGNYSIFVQVEKLSDGDAPTGQPQPNWRWCDNCQGLFYGPGQPTSSCPAGGTHTAAEVSRSGNYSLAHDLPTPPGYQDNWSWCNKCQGLYWGLGVHESSCPAGDRHAAPADSGSWNYSLPHNAAPSPAMQPDWRWCDKCQGLFFGGGQATSKCPTGGTHAAVQDSGSGNYSLPHIAHQAIG